MKRRRVERERFESVGERERAAGEFVAAIREAEAALEAIRAANDKLYRADDHAAQVSLTELRGTRERMFSFIVAKEVLSQAPLLSRALQFRVAPTQAMPLVEWIRHVAALDVAPVSADIVPITGVAS